MVEEVLVGVVARRQTLNLANGAHTARDDAAAVHIVVDSLRGSQDVHDAHLRVDTAGEAGADDGIGVMLMNEAHSAHGSVDLADAALPEHDFVVAHPADVAAKSVTHLAILDVHCYNNSYLHI